MKQTEFPLEITKPKIMKAIITELWDTGIDIISTEGGENEITSIADLRKCDNVLVGEKCFHGQATEVMIGNLIAEVSFRTVSHPTGLGELRICQIN